MFIFEQHVIVAVGIKERVKVHSYWRLGPTSSDREQSPDDLCMSKTFVQEGADALNMPSDTTEEHPISSKAR
jgi:hypothetical protein